MKHISKALQCAIGIVVGATFAILIAALLAVVALIAIARKAADVARGVVR